MKNKFLIWLVMQLLGMLSPEILREGLDKLLDFIEAKVAETPGIVDDAIVIPLCRMIRTAFNIPE
jgi:hypothetical protein